MKNLLLILIAVLLLMFLNACAVMDINSMDTAVPLKPGKIELALITVLVWTLVLLWLSMKLAWVVLLHMIQTKMPLHSH